MDQDDHFLCWSGSIYPFDDYEDTNPSNERRTGGRTTHRLKGRDIVSYDEYHEKNHTSHVNHHHPDYDRG